MIIQCPLIVLAYDESDTDNLVSTLQALVVPP